MTYDDTSDEKNDHGYYKWVIQKSGFIYRLSLEHLPYRPVIIIDDKIPKSKKE